MHARGLLMRPSFSRPSRRRRQSTALFEHGELRGRHGGRGILERRHGDAQVPRVQVRLEVRRRARDDRVEVLGVPLRLHQALPSSGRAAVPVRQPRPAIVELRDQRLGLHRRLVDGAIREVHELFRMTDGEQRVAALVARIGGRRRVAFLHRRHHRRKADDAGPAAAADELKLAVPVLRQPGFHFDLRIRRRPQDRVDPAARGNDLAAAPAARPGLPGPRAGAPAGAGGVNGPACHHLRGHDCRVRERQRLQALARRG